jgi:hypothetical protein
MRDRSYAIPNCGPSRCPRCPLAGLLFRLILIGHVLIFLMAYDSAASTPNAELPAEKQADEVFHKRARPCTVPVASCPSDSCRC